MCDRLWREDFIYVGFGSQNPAFSSTTPVLYGLATKGLIEIAEWPDRDEWFVAALEALRRAAEQEPAMPESKRREILDTASKLITLTNGVRDLGRAAFQVWTSGGAGQA